MRCAAFLRCVRNKHGPFHADMDFEVFPRHLHARHHYIVADGSVGENLQVLALAFSLNVSNSLFYSLVHCVVGGDSNINDNAFRCKNIILK